MSVLKNALQMAGFLWGIAFAGTPSPGQEPRPSQEPSSQLRKPAAWLQPGLKSVSVRTSRPQHWLPAAGESPSPTTGAAMRSFDASNYHWLPSELASRPLYFQDVPLERYGQSASRLTQPFLSGAKFYRDLLILPYKMGSQGPRECNYTLGYRRPGNPAPAVREYLPFSWRGVMWQAKAAAGVVLLTP